MYLRYVVVVILVFLILSQPISAHLTEGGKRWLAKHAGINGCFTDHGIKIIDPVKGESEVMDTSSAIAGFFVMQALGGIYKFYLF